LKIEPPAGFLTQALLQQLTESRGSLIVY
jgi:hypothetical protein